MIEQIKKDVEAFMNSKAGHGFDHVERVSQIAQKLMHNLLTRR